MATMVENTLVKVPMNAKKELIIKRLANQVLL